MQTEWERVLDFEAQFAAGEAVAGFESLHFLQQSVSRVAYLLNEADLNGGTFTAHSLFKALIYHFGDTAIIENTHTRVLRILSGTAGTTKEAGFKR